ncbi:MAG: HAMP domain-containing histidine kinase [Clostridiales bacterium]|nr:HAMP domain-containing histidine kinase [Clostridiales bacterium]
MSFLRDKISRRYFFLLMLFSLMLVCAALFFCIRQSEMAKEMLLDHDRAIAASLLEQGVSAKIIMSALSDTQVSEQGDVLLQKAGIMDQTAFIFFPLINNMFYKELLWAIIVALLLIALYLGTSIVFLSIKENVYRSAVQVILKYKEGNFSPHLPRAGGGTLYQLFSSIEQLATQLQARNEAEQKSRQFLKDTITDISHQLKTPLAALNMYHEFIAEEPDNVKTVTHFSEKTGLALERMESLIQALLKITRLDAGSIEFKKEACTVSELFMQATETLATRAALEDKQLICEGSDEETLVCDLQWTGEALGNLVKNALDYISPGGCVRLSWERSPAMLRLFIRDNGAGIAPEDLHKIFRRFYRSKGSLDKQGVGLGLPLAKAIIEGQGGVLAVQSVPGQGTVFTVSFLTEL